MSTGTNTGTGIGHNHTDFSNEILYTLQDQEFYLLTNTQCSIKAVCITMYACVKTLLETTD